MKKKHIENYLEKRGMNPKQKLERDRGGQFLINFLNEFAEHVRFETLNETVGIIKKLRYYNPLTDNQNS